MEFLELKKKLELQSVTLVAVSKTQPIEAIMSLYDQGQRIFGENKVQELLDKRHKLPNDIRWHLIGHLQTNKVKSIIAEVDLIHSVDSLRLLQEISKESSKQNIEIKILIQLYIAKEETKYGLDLDELDEVIDLYNNGHFPNVVICGLMGMASFTKDTDQVRKEFEVLGEAFVATKKRIKNAELFLERSMGMSGDYSIAIEQGSTLVRIGSLLFGQR